MSIPSSSDAVATTALSSPCLSASSVARRSSRLMLPWWARKGSGRPGRVGLGDLRRRLALTAPVAAPRRVASLRSFGELVEPRGQLFDGPPVVGEDDRRAVVAHERQQLAFDLGPDRAR